MSLVMQATAELKEQTHELGFDLVGVCAAASPSHFEAYRAWLQKGFQGTMSYLERHSQLKSHPKELLPSVQSVIAVGLNYNQPNPAQAGHPRIARYALGRDYHKVLRGKLKRLQAWLQSKYPDSEARACVDSAPIMERDFANQAGLGWYGKNTMLINSQRGSWFFLGILLTSVKFQPDSPALGGCGNCKACIEACPTGAIVFEEDRWQVDARRCISYLTIEHEGEIEPDLAAKMDGWTFGCDVCQEVCPFNQARDSQPLRAQDTEERDFLSRKEWPSLEEVATLDEERWDQLTQGSPTRRTGLAGIQRNAKINLANED